MKAKPTPSQVLLKKVFDYNQETGIVTWKKTNKEAGYIDTTGYRRIRFKGRLYLSSRLIWKWMTGEEPKNTIDHINRVRTDNSWANLKEATMSEQRANKHHSGGWGKGYYKNGSGFEVRVRKGGKIVFSKTVKTEEEAIALRASKRLEIHGTR